MISLKLRMDQQNRVVAEQHEPKGNNTRHKESETQAATLTPESLRLECTRSQLDIDTISEVILPLVA